MATWVNPDTIQRPSTNATIPSAWGDAINDDLNLVANSLQYFGSLGSQGPGTPPGLGAPKFLLQVGVSNLITDGAGNTNIVFPAAFPTGCVFCLGNVYFPGGLPTWNLAVRSASKTGAGVTLWNSTNGATGGSTGFVCHWIAIGW